MKIVLYSSINITLSVSSQMYLRNRVLRSPRNLNFGHKTKKFESVLQWALVAIDCTVSYK